MKKFLLMASMLISLYAPAQFLMFLDKGDTFKSPETDMVVMDKYSFAKYHYISEKYNTLKSEVLKYDSLLDAKDSVEKHIREDYEKLIASKDLQVKVLTEAYSGVMKTATESIDRLTKLQVDYLKLERKNRCAKRLRNFFIGTTAVLSGIIYMVIR